MAGYRRNNTRPMGTTHPTVSHLTPKAGQIDLSVQLSNAVQLHQAGELLKAKAIYEHILSAHPWHVDA